MPDYTRRLAIMEATRTSTSLVITPWPFASEFRGSTDSIKPLRLAVVERKGTLAEIEGVTLGS
jgi:hypothetical protein